MASEIQLKINAKVKSATDKVGKLGQAVQSVKSGAEGATGGFKKLGNGIKGIGNAIKVAGIGLLIGVFVALKESLARNQGAMDLMASATATVSTTFNQVVEVLSGVVKWVGESSDRFNGLGATLKGVVTLALTPLKFAFYSLKLGVESVMLAWEDSFLGGGDQDKITALRISIRGTKNDILEIGDAAIQAGKDVSNNIGDAIGEIGAIYNKASEGLSEISIKANFEQAKTTTAAVEAAKFAQAEYEKLNAQFKKDAEDQRQIRDNISKTFAERIEANNKLNDVLAEQTELSKKQIQLQINAAALLVAQNGSNENKLELAKANNEMLKLEEEINGQLSEQIVNREGLEKELADVTNMLREEGLEGMDRELEALKTAYNTKVELARQAGVDIAAITAQYEKDGTAIKKTESDKQADLDKALQDQKVALAMNGLGLIAAIAGEGTKIAQGAAIAQATISGIVATQEAFKSGVANIPMMAATGGSFGYIQAGLAASFSALQIKKLMSPSPGGVSSMPSAPSTTSSSPAPQFSTGQFDLTGGGTQEPIEAYVVTDSMTNSQDRLSSIRRRATI